MSDDASQVFINYHQIRTLIDCLLLQAASKYPQPDLVLCPLNGARYIGLTLEVHNQYKFNIGYPKIHTYDRHKQSGGVKFVVSPKLATSIKNSHYIWIWDDIYDTGFTMSLLSALIPVINTQAHVYKIALYGRKLVDDVLIGEITDKWVVFPWEQLQPS